MAENWKNNILPNANSLDLGSLAYDEDTSLSDIAGKYTNLGAQAGSLAKAAFDDVHTRQVKLVGNDFGQSPMMYAAYYQPTTNDIQSEMRMKGTEKALGEGMERGKAAAEADLQNAQNEYNEAMDAYKNAKEAFSNLQISTIDPNLLPNGVTESEMLSFDSFTGDRETARSNIQVYTDAQNVDWSKSDIWSNAAQKAISAMGVDTTGWGDNEWREFWDNKETGRLFTNYYISEYIGRYYGEEKQQAYEESYNTILKYIDDVFDYINEISDQVPKNKTVEIFYAPLNSNSGLDAGTEGGKRRQSIEEAVFGVDSSEEAKYHWVYEDLTSYWWIDEHIAEEYRDDVKKFSDSITGSTNGYSRGPDKRNVRAKELMKEDPSLSFSDAYAKAEFELGKSYYDYIQDKIIQEEKDEIHNESLTAGEIVENLFGFSIRDMRLLTKWKKENPDEYESYKHQIAQIQGLENTIEVADGERWYWTGNKYEQLPAGTPVFFAYSGALNPDGSIRDDDLKDLVNLWKDFYSADVEAIGEEALTEKQKALNDAYVKYMNHVGAAVMVNSTMNIKITSDVYNSILGCFSGNISQSDYEIDGQKISDIIKEWNEMDQAHKYRAFSDLVQAAYGNTGKFLRYSGTTNSIVAEDLYYKGDSDASGYSRLDSTQGAFGTSTKESSKYAGMTPEKAAPYFLAITRSMEQYNKGVTQGNINPGFMDRNFFQHAGISLGQQAMGMIDFWGAALAFVGGVIATPINAIIGNDPNPAHNEFMGIKGLSTDNIIGAAFSGKREYDMENSWQSAEYLTALDKQNREYAASVINPLLIDVYFSEDKQDISTVRGLGDAFTSEGGGMFKNWNSVWKTGVDFANMFLLNWLEGKAISGVATGIGNGISALANSSAAAKLQLKLLPSMIKNSSNATIVSGKIAAVSNKIIEISSLIDNIDDPVQLSNALKSAISELDDLGVDTSKIAKLVEKSDDIDSLRKAADELIKLKNSAVFEGIIDATKAPNLANYGILSSEAAAALSSLSTNDLGKLLTDFGEFAKTASKTPSTKSSITAISGLNKITLASGEVVTAVEATAVVAANRVTGVMTLASATGIAAQDLAALPDAARQILLRTLNGMASASDATITNGSLRSFLKSLTPEDFKNLVAEFVSRNELNLAIGKNWDVFDTYRAAAAAGWERSGVTALTREFLTDALTDPLRDFKRNVSVPEVDKEGNVRVQTVQEYFTDFGNILRNLAFSTVHFGISRMYNQVAMTASAYRANKAWDAYAATGDKNPAEANRALARAIELNSRAMRYADRSWKRGLSYKKATENAELSNKIVDDAVEQIFKQSSWDLDWGGKQKHFTSAKQYENFITKKNMPAKDGLYVIATSTNIKAINNYYMFKTQIGTAWNEAGNIPQSARLGLLNTFNDVHKANIDSIKAGSGTFEEKNHAMYQLMKDAALKANNAGEYGVKIRNLEKSLNSFFGNLEAAAKSGSADGTLKQLRIGYIPTSSLYFDGSFDDMKASHKLAATRGLLHEGGSVDVSAANPAEPRDLYSLDALLTAMNKGEKTFDVRDESGNVLKTVQLDYDGTNLIDIMSVYSNNYNLHKYVDPLMGDSRTNFGAAGLQNNHAYIIGNWNKIQKAWNTDIKNLRDKIIGYDYTDANGKKAHYEGWHEKIAARAIADGMAESEVKMLMKKGFLEVNVMESDKTKLNDLRDKYKKAEAKQKRAQVILDQGDSPNSVYPLVSTVFHLDKNGIPDVEGAKAIMDNGQKIAKILIQDYTEGKLTEEALRGGYTIKTKSGLRDLYIDENMLRMIDSAAKDNGQINSDLIFHSAVAAEAATPYKLVSNERGIKVKEPIKDYVNRLEGPTTKARAEGDTRLGKIGDYNVYTGNVRPDADTIFVFGSNPEGRHGAGAAKVAVKMFGAKYGQGEGLQGNSYALPTKELREIPIKPKGYGTVEYDNMPASSRTSQDYAYAAYLNEKKIAELKRTKQEWESNGFKDSIGNDVKVVDSPMKIAGSKDGIDSKWNRLLGDIEVQEKLLKQNKKNITGEVKTQPSGLPKEQITANIKKMYAVAEQNPTKKFKVAYRSDNNLNGYSLEEMANMFKAAGKAPDNVYFSKEMGEKLAGVVNIDKEVAAANKKTAVELFDNDEGEVTFGGTVNARTNEVSGGVTVNAATYYPKERNLGRNEQGEVIEKTSESMIKTDEDVATAALYKSTGVKNKGKEPNPTAFQKRYAESVIDRTKTELSDAKDSYNGAEWIRGIDKNAGDPELVKMYGVDNDIMVTSKSLDKKTGNVTISTKNKSLATQVKSLEQAGAVKAFKNNLDDASASVMAGEVDSKLPDGMSREQLASIIVKARDFMETGEQYSIHPRKADVLTTKIDEDGSEMDFDASYLSSFDENGEQIFDMGGRIIDLEKGNVKEHLNSFKYVMEAFSYEDHPLHDLFVNEELDDLMKGKIKFLNRTDSIADDLNNQLKALYESGTNPEFNKQVDTAYQNIVARVGKKKVNTKAGQEAIKYQYLEAIGVAAPRSGLNSIGVGGYGQSTRRYYAALTAKATGIEDLGAEGWGPEVTRARLEAGTVSGYAGQLVKGVKNLQGLVGENGQNTKLLKKAQRTNYAIDSLLSAKNSETSDNFENSIMAMFADVYDRKAMSPIANRAEIDQYSRDLKWKLDNIISETLTGKKAHNEGVNVSKVGDSAELGFSLKQMDEDLGEFYRALDDLNESELAGQYWRHARFDVIPGEEMPELLARYNILLENLYTKYASGQEATEVSVPSEPRMSIEKFAVDVMAKDENMFKAALEARGKTTNAAVGDYDEAGRTIISKKMASEGNPELKNQYEAYLSRSTKKQNAPKQITIDQFEDKLLNSKSEIRRLQKDFNDARNEYDQMGGKNIIAPSAAQGKISIFTPEQLSYSAILPSTHWIPENLEVEFDIDGTETALKTDLHFGTSQEHSETAVGASVTNRVGEEIDLPSLDKATHKKIVEDLIIPSLEQSNSGLAVWNSNETTRKVIKPIEKDFTYGEKQPEFEKLTAANDKAKAVLKYKKAEAENPKQYKVTAGKLSTLKDNPNYDKGLKELINLRDELKLTDDDIKISLKKAQVNADSAETKLKEFKKVNKQVFEDVKISQAEIDKKIANLKVEESKAVARVSEARSLGDLSENEEYHAARRELAQIKDEIEDLEDLAAKRGLYVSSDSSEHEILQDLGYGYYIVSAPGDDDILKETNYFGGEREYSPQEYMDAASAQYAYYTKNYNPAKEIAKAQKDYDSATKELASIKKRGEKVSKKIKQKTTTIDDVAKKYLTEYEYKLYKEDADAYKYVKEHKPTEGDTFYESFNGKYKIKSGNIPAGYTTIKTLLELCGYDMNNFNHDISTGRVYTEEEIAKDLKQRKKMMKQVNKNLRKGNVRYRNVQEYKNPTVLDIKSQTATINNLLAFVHQASKASGLKKGQLLDASEIAIDKDYGDLLFRISREGIQPKSVKGYLKTALFELSDWNKFMQDFQLAGGASYMNAMSIAQLRGAILSNPTKMLEYIKLVTDFKDDPAVAHFVNMNGAKLSDIAMRVGDASILTDFQASASARPDAEGGTLSATASRLLENYNNRKNGDRSGFGDKYEFSKDAVQSSVNALFSDATFNRMLPILRAKMLIMNYDNAVRALKRHFKQFDSDNLSASDAELLNDAACKYAYARTTAFFEPNKTAGGVFRNKSITDTLNNIYDDNLRKFLASWTGAKDDISLGQMTSNCFFALGYKQRMIQPLAQGAKSMFGIGNIKDRLSMMKQADEATPELLEKLGTQFMQGGNRQQIRSLATIAVCAFLTSKALGLATSWDDLSFVDEADGEFKVPDILKKFQTIGQIWIPNSGQFDLSKGIDWGNSIFGLSVDPTKPAYNIDTMSSIFTLPNVGWKTIDRMFNPNAYYSAPQRGVGLIGQEMGINAQGFNDFLNNQYLRGIADELIGSNLLSPYKAMYEVLVDASYYGNNIWEKKWLSDGSKNPNYDPMRNMKASFFHILGLDNYRTLSPRKYNDYVKGYYTDDYKSQDQIGSISGAGILQHEYVTAIFNILEGDALDGVIEAGELPIKKQKFSSTARTDFNTRVKNIIAQYMAEYNNKVDGVTDADIKDAAYADAVKKCADAVASWSKKYGYVLGKDQSLVPYVTRSLMAVLAGEYDDRLDYIQNTYWKASQIAQIEASGPAEYWLDDSDVDAWIASGKTTEEFAAEKNKRHEAYNQALDEEYRARKALHDAGVDNEYLAGMSLQNLRAEQRAVNKAAYYQAKSIMESKIGEFNNFKELKAYYEARIDAATNKKTKAKLADQYNTYVTDALAPLVNKYGAGIISDGYYNNNYLSNYLAEYIIIPADKSYGGKSPRANYLKDLFHVGYRDFSKEPSDKEVLEGYAQARKQMVAGYTASAIAVLDRTIDAIKKGQLHVTDIDYSKIIRMKALLSARS